MEWGKMFVFALLLAGISFSAVSQAAAMEKAYGMQVCKIEYYRDLVDLTGNYIPEADKISSRDVQWYETKIIAASTYLAQGTGFFDQDLALLESTKGTKSLYASIKTSNAHLRSAYTLYSQFATKYARYGGREARMQIASDRTEPMADYRQCILCVRNPNDASCAPICSVAAGSEIATLEIKEARILEDGNLSYLGAYNVTLHEGETFTSPDGVEYTLREITHKINSGEGTCSVSDSEAYVWRSLPGVFGEGSSIQEGMWAKSYDYWCNWYTEVSVLDISEELSK